MALTQWLLLIFLSVLWGGSFLFIGVAVQELPTLTLVFARVGLAAVLLLPVIYAMGLRLPSRLTTWRDFALMSLLNNVVPFLLIVRGQKEIASGLASVLNATTPLFAVILSHYFVAEGQADLRRIAGVLIGMTGVAILVGPEALFGQPASVFGMTCVLGAAISYAISGLWGKRFRNIPLPVTAAGPLICSTLFLLPLTLMIDRPWLLATPSTATIASVLALASLSTALAYVIFFRIMAVSGPTNTMLVTLLIPVSAIAFGTLVLNEVLLPRHIIGALVIAMALLVLDGRVLKLFRRGTLTPPQ